MLLNLTRVSDVANYSQSKHQGIICFDVSVSNLVHRSGVSSMDSISYLYRMRLCLIFLMLIISGLVSAQAPAHYIRSYGNAGSDGGVAVCHDSNGNTYATGYFSGNMMADSSTYLSSYGGSDIYIIKNDSEGNLIWAIKAGGTGSDKPSDIVYDISGYIYITGYFSGTANFGTQTVSSSGLRDFFIAKFDVAGNTVWVRTGGGAFPDEGKKIDVDLNGNCAVTGIFSDTASFGASTLYGMNYNTAGTPSVDIFIAYYNASGNLMWIKKGSSVYSDLSTGVTFDAAGNIYVTGQFSDTIYFAAQYPNNMYNSCFVLKLDNNGNEVWFRKIGGGIYNFITDITVSTGGKVITTGYFKGSPFVDDASPVTISSNYDYGVFIIQWNQNGGVNWVRTFGSDCYVEARALAVDDSSNIYLGGNFKCKLDAFSDVFGAGAFNSTGFQDVLAAKFDSTGSFVWARNYGGQLEDNLSDISVNAFYQPVITGRYENRMMFPVLNDASFNLLTYGNVGLPTAYEGQLCNELQNWRMFHVVSKGATDAFLAKPFHPDIQPYYYYFNHGDANCSRPFVKVEISVNQSDDRSTGTDTVATCSGLKLVAHSNTSRITSFNSQSTTSPGPRFTYLWSTGETTREIQPTQSGTYWVRLTSLDSCFSSSDTVIYIKHALPTKPRMSDSQGVNAMADTTQLLYLCKPDSLQLTVHTDTSYQIMWLSTPLTYDSTSIVISPANQYLTVTSVGSNLHQYLCRVTDDNGCSSANFIRVQIDTALSFIQPAMMFFHPVTGAPVFSDTLRICELSGSQLRPAIYDSLKGLPPGHILCYNQIHLIPYADYSWSLAPGPAISSPASCEQSHYFQVNNSGWYTVNCMMTRQSPCPGAAPDTFYIQKSIYLLIDPAPNTSAQISGSQVLCEGDSVLLSGSGGGYYSWYYNSVNPQNYITGQQQIYADSIGTYILTVSDTNQYGCFQTSVDFIDIESPPQPSLNVSPVSALLCPGDSVAISVTASGTYTWYGPGGIMAANTQMIYVIQTGTYYCEIDSGGCFSTSVEVEINGYSTPSISVSPDEVICSGEEITLELNVNSGSVVQWLPPLSGSSLEQVIDQPGTYICQVVSCGILTIDSVVITPSVASAVILPAGPLYICEGSVVTLSANHGMAFYQWSPEPSYSPELSISESGFYSLMTTDLYGCSAFSDTVEVIVTPSPISAYIVSNGPVCSGDSLHVSATVDTSASFQWIFPDGSQSSVPNIVFIHAYTHHSGLYIAVQSNVNCSMRDTIEITIDSLSYTGITTSGVVCTDENFQIETEPRTGHDYYWIYPNNNISAGPELTFNPLQLTDAGIYTLNITAGACAFSDTVEVVPELCSDSHANVFTPNGDGLNDVFTFSELQAGGTVIVMNRWGAKVFETGSPSEPWDGTKMNTGQQCTEGVYFYIIENRGSKVKPIHGFIQLIR